jgi:outer membrane lipoprotein-sorting protein
LRVDYNPPVQIQIIANEKKLFYYDKELDEVTKIGMKRTPVSFLLSEDFSFNGKKIAVVDFEKGKRTIQISLKNTKKDELGIMTMVFDSHPLTLRKIRLKDEFGQMTDVSFYDIDVKSVINAEMFKVRK